MTTRTLKLTYPDFLGELRIKENYLLICRSLTKHLKHVIHQFTVFRGRSASGLRSFSNQRFSNFNFPRFKFSLPQINKEYIKRILPISIIVIATGFTVVWFGRLLVKTGLGGKTGNPTDTRIAILGARSQVQLNRDFTFSLVGSNGKKITDLKFAVESAELRDEIIVKGKKATAIQGRTFLIINLKITSSYDKGLNISTQDYFRLTVNGKDSDLLAPEIHNDPVLVSAISTKFTRIGFPIFDTDKHLKLLVGEILGNKTIVDLNL